MQYALGLMGDQAIMIGITLALGIGGIIALFMALFWPRRWRLHYRIEVAFIALLVALVIYADNNSAATYRAYEMDLPDNLTLSGQALTEAPGDTFDRRVRVYAYQWGFIFFDETGAASRNAVRVAPGERVLFTLMANDVIHGFNIPAARLTTEFEPGDTRSVWIQAPQSPGEYLIQCLNYCGLGHTQMKSWLVVGDVSANAAEQERGSDAHMD